MGSQGEEFQEAWRDGVRDRVSCYGVDGYQTT